MATNEAMTDRANVRHKNEITPHRTIWEAKGA